MDDIYKNIEAYNPNKKLKILIVFNDMIAGMLSDQKLNPIVTELFIRSRKLNISLAFFVLFYTILFCCAKNYYTKFFALFYYEHFKQRRSSTNCISSFVRF